MLCAVHSCLFYVVPTAVEGSCNLLVVLSMVTQGLSTAVEMTLKARLLNTSMYLTLRAMQSMFNYVPYIIVPRCARNDRVGDGDSA